MNWVDLAVIVLVGISAAVAFMRGFVRESLGIAAWAGAAYVSFIGIDYVRLPVRDLVGNPEMAEIVGYAVLFLVALLVLTIVTSVIAQIIHALGLGALDRSLGILFGIARGAVLAVAAYVAAGWLAPSERWPVPVREARLLPLVADGASRLAAQIPERYRPSVQLPPDMPATRSLDLLQAVPLGRQPAKQ
ncbi:MAG: CvpA family protein [Acetobacteraceae bacterium]|nr:CvpA family protein [Acetobacteraceae bacterium]